MKSNIKRDIRNHVKEYMNARNSNEISRDDLYQMAAVALYMEMTLQMNQKLNDKIERHDRTR